MWRSSDTNDAEHEIHRGSLAGKGERGRGPPTDTEAHSNAAVGKCAISSDNAKRKGSRGTQFCIGFFLVVNKFEWHRAKLRI